MGIKHFWPWFKQNFDDNIFNMPNGVDFNTLDINVDTFMIDMNGLFHTCTQKVYRYGNNKPPDRLLGGPRKIVFPTLKKQLEVFDEICQSIDRLRKIVNPKKKLVLCVDGSAPLAKQTQQRSRRFVSVMNRDIDDKSFNHGCLTPGTKFMDYLSKYIDWYIRKQISTNDEWKNLDVVFSSEKTPGEGEHGLINYIRHHGTNEETYCIHGMDADLIMLSLATHKPNFYLIRDDNFNYSNNFYAVNIGAIRDDLSQLIRWHSDEHEFIMENSINDFVFLCFMVGNDFLPHIPSLEIIENGIDIIIHIYKTVSEEFGHLTVKNKYDNVQFRKKPLKEFFTHIASHEKNIIDEKLNKKASTFEDEILQRNTNIIDGKFDVNIEAYRKDYCNTLFKPDSNPEEITHHYMEGLQWVLSYYTKGLTNWRWFYPYHYIHSAHILAKYVDSYTPKNYEDTEPIIPFVQLLCVLPPKSAEFLPKEIQPLLTDKNSKLNKYCPDNFKIDLSGKRKDWEGIPILPFTDVNVVIKEYNKLSSKISKEDMKRNVLYKHSSLYSRNDSDYEYLYKSYYGDIPHCKTNVSQIIL